ncbi:glutamic acid-rich protein [Diachasma alloeum]|uniref:glutamic acid-rich protein n=1 Tax=Diachasma alloeum TaxID=454923 RepID=UPI0007384642|nr:glutamic acid-rich protein [Diachasma alloeum]
MVRSKDSLRNRSKKGTSDASSSQQQHEESREAFDEAHRIDEESKEAKIEDNDQKSDLSGIEEQEEELSLTEKDVNKDNSDGDEPRENEDEEDETGEVVEVNRFWRFYEIIKCYYRYFSNNLENIIDDLTLRLFNFYFGMHQQQ